MFLWNFVLFSFSISTFRVHDECWDVPMRSADDVGKPGSLKLGPKWSTKRADFLKLQKKLSPIKELHVGNMFEWDLGAILDFIGDEKNRFDRRNCLNISKTIESKFLLMWIGYSLVLCIFPRFLNKKRVKSPPKYLPFLSHRPFGTHTSRVQKFH